MNTLAARVSHESTKKMISDGTNQKAEAELLHPASPPEDPQAGQRAATASILDVGGSPDNVLSSRSHCPLPAYPPDQTLSESAESEVLYVTPVVRSERNVFTNRSRDSSEVQPIPRSTGIHRHDDIARKASPWWRPCCIDLQKGSSSYQAYLSFLTLGVIYGDIGTSPLYTMSAMFPTAPTSPDAVIGGLSLILWSIIIVVLIKYIGFILIADDYGEGGTFALFALLSRGLREKIKDDNSYRRVNYGFSVVAILGVSAIMADGVLTPAISVMGAISGLSVVSPAIDTGVTAGVSCAILFLFFLPQRFGTSRISSLFSPIILVWYIALASIGIYNISRYPQVMTAFNPYEAIKFLRGNYDGFGGWFALGSAFLAVTGSEAMYADLGHFNRRAIRVSAIGLVVPALIITYCGQAAALIKDPEIYPNIMFLSLPNGLLYPMLALATMASIVASQAMVSATFSITAQAIRLQYLPRLTIHHTDRREFGQVYIPEINYFLMVLVIAVVAGYRDVNALSYAYGVTVSLAFCITSFFYSFVTYFCFKKHPVTGVVFILAFGSIDANFLAANLTKFLTGGWFSIAITLLLTCILIVWRWGRFRMVEAQKMLNMPMDELYGPRVEKDDTGTITQVISPLDVETPLLIVFSTVTGSVPAAFSHFTKRIPVRPRNVVFVTIATVNVAFVEQDLLLTKIECHNGGELYKLVVHHGYCERPPCANKLAAFLIRKLMDDDPEDPSPIGEMLRYFPPPTDSELFRYIDPTFVVGRDRAVSKAGASILHQLLVEFFQILLFFSRPASAVLAVPPENVLEVGIQVQI